MDGQSQMIELKGIVRNRTKLGVEDGQCEDIINMRFRNGAWRPSGDGKFVFVMGATDNSKPYVTASYEQIYVHTNIYRHVLGVRDSTLYWFAEIDKDGETFYPLDNTSDRSSWPTDYQSLPTAPVALTTVTGDVWITQTGHLLTIIDEDKSFEYLVFKTGDQVYIKPITDNVVDNDKRELYPFGQIHFNYHAPKPELLFEERTINLARGQDGRAYKEDDYVTKNHPYLCLKLVESSSTTDDVKTITKGMFGEIAENNVFSQPLLVCAAVKLYDGTYAYASNPVLIYPRQQASAKRLYKKEEDGSVVIDNFENCQHYNDSSITSHYPTSSGVTQEQEGVVQRLILNGTPVTSYTGVIDTRHVNQTSAHLGYPYSYQLPQIEVTNMEEDILPSLFPCVQMLGETGDWYVALLGYDLVMSISDYSILEKNKDIFQSLCVFITPEVQNYDVDHEYTYYFPTFLHRQSEDIIYDLTHSPMYLLKEYKISELSMHKENQKIDLSSKEDENILKNIVEQEQLPIEATSRTTYLPKVSYMYNGRLHIANYKSYPFFGYPLDLFHLHNHSVKVEDGKWFPNDTTQKVLRNLTGNSDDILQFPKAQKAITNIPDLVNAGAPYFLMQVHIDADQGEQIVCRYIPAYNPSTPEEGRADFIEDLNALLTFPDVRANKMEIFYVSSYSSGNVYIKHKAFDLKPHPYMNMAYYIDPDLKPIKLADFDDYEQE